jgi:hypothetical protein
MGDDFDPSSVEWLLILAFPNGGSTALAETLLSAEGTLALHPRAEGQWLSPAMSAPGVRWNPNAAVDYDDLLARWMAAIRQSEPVNCPGEEPLLIVEKSPPNMCRYQAIRSMLGGMKTTTVVMTRDPYATCASWQALGPERIGRNWGWPDAPPTDDRSFHYALGRIWAQRARYLLAARSDALMWLRYEDFAERPATVLQELARHVPRLRTADAVPRVRVKTYPPQTVRNMNAEQITRLSGDQRDAISSALSGEAGLVEQLGYFSRHDALNS